MQASVMQIRAYVQHPVLFEMIGAGSKQAHYITI